MPMFVSDEELQKIGDDVAAVVARADEYARELLVQVETHKARADAAIINAEQTCSLVEQKYVALMGQVTHLESEKAQIASLLESKSSELAHAQARAHQIELQLMKRDGDMECKAFEVKEMHKSKKELLDVIEQKNSELDEKNASLKLYLDKVLALTEERSNLESRLHEQGAELVRLRAHKARTEQEKDITTQHNTWLDQELSSKLSLLLEERQKNTELEAALQAKLSEAERVSKEKDEELNRSQDRAKDLESELHQLIEELRFVKEDAAVKEEHLSNEVATASKLAELYKQSSEEWARKSNDLEGVIKALEVHLNQVRVDYDERIQKEVDARQALETESAAVKQTLEKKLEEIEQTKSADNGFLHLDDAGLTLLDKDTTLELHGNEIALPRLPYGISGTALAASLLRDGWTLATVYTKYQEAVDAWRHERHERNRCQALLDRVLHEIEEKAEMILDERAEYKRMVDSYKIMEEKLRLSVSDQAFLESTVRDLKAELRKKERALKGAQKDVSDLQTQVSVLLKECSDVQRRHGIGEDSPQNDDLPVVVSPVPDTTSSDAVISDKLLTFKDIRGMVEHNTQLRALVRVLAQQNEQKEQELQEEFDAQLKKRIDEASEKVSTVLKRAEEQNQIIESLKGTVGMYKRLCEERSIRPSLPLNSGAPTMDSDHAQNWRRVTDISQDDSHRQLKEATERIKSLEEELTKARHDVSIARAECARAEAEASFAREQLSSLMRESENQRKQMDSILLRNMELSEAITDYQRRLRESSQNVKTAEDETRRLSIEVSVLEREKELLANAEKRASEEASKLSDRVHRLQATLATIESAEEVREVSRAAEKKKLEDEVNRMQREWVDAKNELELERSHVRSLISDRDKTTVQAMERVEALSVELKGALTALSASEVRAKVAEARSAELEANLKKADDKIMAVLAGGKRASVSGDTDAQVLSSLQESREEIEVLKDELSAVKGHAEQYKHIAQANEEALKKMEEAHSRFREEAAKTKDVMDSELKLLQEQLSNVEALSLEKEKEAGALQSNKESLLRNAAKEIALLKDAEASKQASLEQAEGRINALKEDLEKQHRQWREAQNNYERQVMLQADTIRELVMANERLASLEQQEKKLREKADNAEAELESVKVSFFMDKASLEAEKDDMEQRVKELDEQNRLLLDRLEARHVTLAEQERKATASEGNAGESKEEADLQNVIHYLRRSKEAADTEISLLKQERARLNKQFEATSRAAEDAQAKLRQQYENMRVSLYTDEEFRALQAEDWHNCRMVSDIKMQVMEMNLLRESNAQLREENKRMFEESRELQERVCKLEEEHEFARRSLKEKDIELESAGNEIEFLKTEIQRWQQRLSQMLEKYKALDVEDYERVKLLLVENEERIKQSQDQLEIVRRECGDCQEKVLKYEHEIALKTETTEELNKRLQDVLQSEASAKAEADKFKRISLQFKRKFEATNREKEEMSKELEEYKANIGKKYIPETMHQEALAQAQKDALARYEAAQKEATARFEAHKESATRSEQAQKEAVGRYEEAQQKADQLLKERETRIQILEKTLEKEREEIRKEKMKREKDRKTFVEMAQKANQEKQRFLDDLQLLRQENDHYRQQAQLTGNTVNDFPGKTDIEKSTTNFQSAVDQASEAAARVSSDTELPSSTTTSASPSNVSDIILAPDVSNISTLAVTIVQPATGVLSVPRQPPFPPSRPSTRLAGASASSTVEADRLREMQELRATILEKEKSQARKSGRPRLIRPRIESSNQPDSATEVPEPQLDGTGEGASVETEVEPVLSRNIEAVENASLPLPAAASNLVLMDLGSHASSLVVASTSHKRSSSDTVDVEQQAEKDDVAPPQKKARGNELLPAIVVTDVVSVEPDNRASQEIPETKGDTGIMPTEVEIEPVHDLPPIGDAVDTAPQRRVRFSRPESLQHDGEASKLREKSPELQTTTETADFMVIAEDANRRQSDNENIDSGEASESAKSPAADSQVEDAVVGDQGDEQTEAVVKIETDGDSPVDTGFMEIGEGSDFPVDVEDGEISLGTVEEAGAVIEAEPEAEVHAADESEEQLVKDDQDAQKDTFSLSAEPETAHEGMKSDAGESSVASEQVESIGSGESNVQRTPDKPAETASPASSAPVANTTIRISERARERAVLRRGGASPPSPGATTAARGRARSLRGAGKARRARGSGRGNM